MAGFHVLLNDPSVLASRTGEVARVLAKALGQPVADVSQRVRYGGGIVARELDEAKAKEIAGKLSEAKIAAFVVPSAAVETLPRARRLSGIAIDEDGLRGLVRGGTKAAEKLPWSRVRSLHVNALARALSPAEVEEGRKPRPMADVEHAPDEVRKLTAEIDFWEDRERTKRLELGIDVIADEPVLVGRMLADDGDYSELAGKKQGALENFMLLVRALCEKAPKSVIVPPSTRTFGEKADWQSVLFDKPEARDAFNLWLLAAVRHGEPFGLEDTGDEIDDAEVEDDEPEKAPEAETAEDADEDSEEAEDEDETGEDDEDEDEDESSEENVKAAGGDAELAKELALFDKTRKFRKKDVEDALEAAKKLEEKPVASDPVAKETTGRWDVSQLMDETKELEDKDL